MRFEEKTVVITAAANGIGREAALEFARRGAHVVVSDRDAAGAAAVAHEAKKDGGSAVSVQCNVTVDRDVDDLVQFTLQHFGVPDVLMNHAGIASLGPLHQFPLEEWRRIYEVNVLGIVRGINAFLPHMIRNGRGLLINTASGLGVFPELLIAIPYITSKAAIIGLSEALALYCRPFNVRVMTLLPDITKTQHAEGTTLIDITKEEAAALLPIAEMQMPADVIAALMDGIAKGHFMATNTANWEQLLVIKAAARNEPAFRLYPEIQIANEQFVKAKSAVMPSHVDTANQASVEKTCHIS